MQHEYHIILFSVLSGRHIKVYWNKSQLWRLQQSFRLCEWYPIYDQQNFNPSFLDWGKSMLNNHYNFTDLQKMKQSFLKFDTLSGLQRFALKRLWQEGKGKVICAMHKVFQKNRRKYFLTLAGFLTPAKPTPFGDNHYSAIFVQWDSENNSNGGQEQQEMDNFGTSSTPRGL